MDQLTLSMELTRLAPSQYQNYAFTEIVKWGDKYFATAEDGIYQIDSGDSDAGSPIPTRWDLPLSDLGWPNQKRFRRVYASGEFHAVAIDGTTYDSLALHLLDDGGNERVFSLVPEAASGRQVGAKANISRDGKGRHWQIRIESDGMDYSIDSLSVLMIHLHRKPSGV